MKIMRCPLNGPRDIAEFVYGGEVETTPAADGSEDAWVDYAFFPENQAGIVREWWLHLATGYWFVAERDTVSDEILRTYPAVEAFGGTPDEPSGGDSEP